MSKKITMNQGELKQLLDDAYERGRADERRLTLGGYCPRPYRYQEPTFDDDGHPVRIITDCV